MNEILMIGKMVFSILVTLDGFWKWNSPFGCICFGCCSSSSSSSVPVIFCRVWKNLDGIALLSLRPENLISSWNLSRLSAGGRKKWRFRTKSRQKPVYNLNHISFPKTSFGIEPFWFILLFLCSCFCYCSITNRNKWFHHHLETSSTLLYYFSSLLYSFRII